MLAVRLDKETESRLNNLATQTHRTKSFYVKQALLEYLDDLEDVFLAQSRLEDLDLGKDKILNSKDFWHGLED